MSTGFNDFDGFSGSGNCSRCNRCNRCNRSRRSCRNSSGNLLGDGLDGASIGSWNPGDDGNVFKNRSPKFVFVTIVKDNNISVIVGGNDNCIEQRSDEEDDDHKHGCGGGRPRLSNQC